MRSFGTGHPAVIRLFTSPNLNVNLAHAIQPGWEHLSAPTGNFGLFDVGCGLHSLGIGNTLQKVWPARNA
jgi:hypothetical protein